MAEQPIAKLPKEYVSLVSHVELNKVGWWDRGICELIKAYLWLHQKAMTKEDIFQGIQDEYFTEIEYQRYEKQIADLIESDVLIPIRGKLKLSEQIRDELDDNARESERFAKRVADKFKSSIKKYKVETSDDGQIIWEDFNEFFLIPLVRDLGVRVLEMLSIDIADFYSSPHFGKFLDKYDDAVKPKLEKVAESFLNPKDKDVRLHFFSYLQAHLLVESNKLDEASIEKVAQTMKRKHKLTILVDTNFLFYLLGLDGGDYKRTGDLLRQLSENPKTRMDMKLYVLPITIAEVQNRIKQEIADLLTIRIIPVIAEVGSISGLVSGIRQRYFERVSQARRNIPPDKYFEPYLRTMPTVLRDNGIEIFQEKTESIKATPSYSEDFNQQVEFQQKKNNGRTKGEKAIEHDMLLWHFCSLKRTAIDSAGLEEPEHWILTVDYQLVSFDKYKQRQTQQRNEICLFPSTLVSMLQLWTPRTSDFEEAVISSIRPLLSSGFDSDSERVTHEILSTISRFEDIDDVSEEVIVNTLMDEGLRSRVRNGSNNVDKDTVQLIQDSLAKRLSVEKEKNKELDDNVKQKTSAIQRMEYQLDASKQTEARLTDTVESLSSNVDTLKQQKDEQESQIGVLSSELNERDEALKQREQRIEALEKKQLEREASEQVASFTRKRIFLPLLVLTPISLIMGYILEVIIPYQISAIVLSTFILTFALYLVLNSAIQAGMELEHVKESEILNLASKINVRVQLILGLIISVVVNLLSGIIQPK